MLENDKYGNNTSIHEYNIYFIVKCWILGEHGDRERISNGKLICLMHDLYRLEVSRWNSIGLSIYTLKNKGQEV
jgi:hypothetical protein